MRDVLIVVIGLVGSAGCNGVIGPVDSGARTAMGPECAANGGGVAGGDATGGGGAGGDPAGGGTGGGSASPDCTQSLAMIVANAASGSTVQLPNCLFRESVTIDKSLSLIGPATVYGSDQWTDWTQQGSVWVSSDTVAPFYSHGECGDPNNMCLKLEQVFIDGVAQLQLPDDSMPGPNEFSVRSDRHFVLGSDPTGKAVEVPTRQTWLNILSDDVTLDGLTFRYVASDSQNGGLMVGNPNSGPPVYSRVTIRNCEISYGSGALVSLGQENADLRVENCDIHHGQQLGLSGCGTNGYVGHNHIHHNNEFVPYYGQTTSNVYVPLWSSGWEAGGMKFGFGNAATGCTIEYNEFDHNGGPGTWADTGYNLHAVWRYNVAHDNANAGIMMEASSYGEIYGNIAWENGWGYPIWLWGPCILVSSSNNASVHDNVVAWCEDGITAPSQDRDPRPHDNNRFERNVIVFDSRPSAGDRVMLGWEADWADPAAGAMTNVGSGNRLWSPVGDSAYAQLLCSPLGPWDTWSLAQFNASTCSDGTNTWMSAAERDAALADAGIPLKTNP
jgi:parallel beta-helix repeat protein